MSADRFEALLAPILDSAYRTALCLTRGPEEAEDLLREAVGRAVRRLAQSGAAGEFRSWFLGIIMETFRARCRLGAPAPSPAAPLSEADRLLAAIRELSPCRRMVAALYFCEGFACREIAGVLGCSSAAVRRRVGPLRAALRPLVLPAERFDAPGRRRATPAIR